MILPIGKRRKNADKRRCNADERRFVNDNLRESALRDTFSEFSFTLIELILVVCIISILVGLSTPRFRKTFVDIQLEAEVNRFVSLIRYAQAESIIEKTVIRLNIDSSKGRVWLARRKNGEFEIIQGKFGRVFFIPSNINCISDSEKIDFFSDGSSESANIVLINTNNKAYKLSAGRAIGHVKVVQMQKE